MPTSAPLIFPAFTDPRTAWVNVAAINTFFNACSVSINAANLPSPTVNDIGGVKLLEIGIFATTALNQSYVNIVADDGVTQQSVPTQAAYDLLSQKIADMENYIQALDAQLRAKGYVSA